MVNAEQIIGNLLLRQNCVIIPGFGGFVAKQTSAKIDYKKGIITPPGKSLLFNRQLINNDGLLISEISRQNALPYDDAAVNVQQMVARWSSDLSAGNRVSIDRVGFLFYDQERNICFEQDKEFNLLLASFGLQSVHFLSETDVAIVQHKLEQEQVIVEEPAIVLELEKQIAIAPVQPIEKKVEQKTIKTTEKTKKSSFWKYAAAACAIPVIFYSIWIPMKTDVLESKIVSFQDFNPFHKQESANYKQQAVAIQIKPEKVKTLEEQLNEVTTNESVYSYNFTDELYLQIQLDTQNDATPVDIKPEVVKNEVHSPQQDHSLNYIVGCFSEESNAQSLVKQLKSKGFSAFVKDVKGGLSRVSIGSTSSQEEMDKLIQQANAAGFNGWVLK